jgi:hypothetical protein
MNGAEPRLTLRWDIVPRLQRPFQEEVLEDLVPSAATSTTRKGGRCHVETRRTLCPL